MKIIINGQACDFDGEHLTYEKLVQLAGEKGNPSVSYSTRRDGDTQRAGTMHIKTIVRVEPGMIFNVMHTNKA